MDYLDCLAQALSRRNVNVTVVWEKQWTIILGVLQRAPCWEVISQFSFSNTCPHPPLSPRPTWFYCLKRNDLCSLCWLINFRLTLLIPYHAHVGTYAIRFYISHDSSFWGPKSEKEFTSKKGLSAVSGWTNCKFSEDPWVASSHRWPLAVFSLGPLSGEPAILSWGGAVTTTSILWRLHSGNWKNNPCKPHHMIVEPGKSLRSNPPYFTGEESEVQRCPHSF